MQAHAALFTVQMERPVGAEREAIPSARNGLDWELIKERSLDTSHGPALPET
jgi:hypothetical protein